MEGGASDAASSRTSVAVASGGMSLGRLGQHLSSVFSSSSGEEGGEGRFARFGALASAASKSSMALNSRGLKASAEELLASILEVNSKSLGKLQVQGLITMFAILKGLKSPLWASRAVLAGSALSSLSDAIAQRNELAVVVASFCALGAAMPRSHVSSCLCLLGAFHSIRKSGSVRKKWGAALCIAHAVLSAAGGRVGDDDDEKRRHESILSEIRANRNAIAKLQSGNTTNSDDDGDIVNGGKPIYL